MKSFLFLFILFVGISSIEAQDKYYTKTGKISINATVNKSLENIEAFNKTVVCIIDTKTGEIQFSVLMKGFEFERALMMEHFNENYVESEKFPKSVFKGAISNHASITYTKEGVYQAKVKGKMTLHGESKDIEAEGKILNKNGKLTITTMFNLTLADYKIMVPKLVAHKVATNAKITVDCILDPLLNK